MKWVADLAGGSPSWPAWAEVKNLEIENISEFSEDPYIINNTTLPLKKRELIPNTTYGVYIQSVPTYESDLAKEWINGNSELKLFTTRNVSASVQSAINIKQASATIRGKLMVVMPQLLPQAYSIKISVVNAGVTILKLLMQRSFHKILIV